MLSAVWRNSSQSGAVYTVLRVITLDAITGRVDKLKRDQPSLPEGSWKQYDCLTDCLLTNDLITNSHLDLFMRTGAYDSRVLFNKKIPHLDKLI